MICYYVTYRFSNGWTLIAKRKAATVGEAIDKGGIEVCQMYRHCIDGAAIVKIEVDLNLCERIPD